MSKDKNPILVNLDDETNTLLREAAAEAGQTISEYVRRAIKARANATPAERIEKRNTAEEVTARVADFYRDKGRG